MLKGTPLGQALINAMLKKGVSSAAVAREFGVKPPSVSEWRKYGRISKEHINHLVSYFSDVVGPDHWGLEPSLEIKPATLLTLDKAVAHAPSAVRKKNHKFLGNVMTDELVSLFKTLYEDEQKEILEIVRAEVKKKTRLEQARQAVRDEVLIPATHLRPRK